MTAPFATTASADTAHTQDRENPTMLKPRSHVRRRLLTYLAVATIIALLAGGGFAAGESHQVSSYGEGLWWALSLMSTVGFVGPQPESVVGRLLSSILMVSGFALMAVVTASVASLFVSEEQQPEEQAQARFEATALEMLAGLQQRLEAIEVTLMRLPPSEPGSTDHHIRAPRDDHWTAPAPSLETHRPRAVTPHSRPGQ